MTLTAIVLAGEQLEIFADVVDTDAALSDDDAGFGGVDDYARLIGTPLDLDLTDRRRTHPAIERLANRDVFVQPIHVVFLFEPAAVPSARDSQAHADRMDLLSHYASLLSRPSPAAALRSDALARRAPSFAASFGDGSGAARRVTRAACTDAPALLLGTL